MKMSVLVLRNLRHYWRMNAAVIAGVAVAVAVLSGALLVGQSVRESLRDLLVLQLGSVTHVVSSDRFFREDLAETLAPAGAPQGCPLIYLRGVVTHEGTGARVNDVHVYGVDDRFWKFHGIDDQRAPEGREALVGHALGAMLGVEAGGGLLLRLETQQGIPRESLYGRRETVGRTVRLICKAMLPEERMGGFALRPSQGQVYSIFVPIGRLQADLAQPGRINMILLNAGSGGFDVPAVRSRLIEQFTLEDAGIRLRLLPAQNGLAVESRRVFLDDVAAQAAKAAAAAAGLEASGVLSYLANAIRVGAREIPYSVIAAADLGQGALSGVRGPAGDPLPPVALEERDAIRLNEWAWRDLGSPAACDVEVDYYHWEESGTLATRTARFKLAGVVAVGGNVDAALAPEFPGITDAASIRAWDPPFPLDLRRIRPRDEEYWNRFRATPKAFIALARGQELWGSRFGRLSAVRMATPGGMSSLAAREAVSGAIRGRLDPESAGFSIQALRQVGLEASRGSTDFGEYFTYFSFFLIAAAVLLAALFFRLGIEQRAREIGTLQAVGFSRIMVRRIFLIEGAALAGIGSIAGVAGAFGYGWLMVAGLRTWWSGAVGMRRLALHLSWADLAAGAAAGVLAALAMVVWTLRGLRRNSPRALLSGILEPGAVRRRRSRFLAITAVASLLAAGALLAGSALERIPHTGGFFGAGLLLLSSLLSAAAVYLRRSRPARISGHGWRAWCRLGARNAMHRPGRSITCIALIASAAFIVISMEAFRKDPGEVSLRRDSGTGGYPLIAESALPVVYDPDSEAGRDALGIPRTEFPDLAGLIFTPFRVRPGDDTSCLNLYTPQEPRILGATHAFLAAGRFSFQDSLAATPEQRRNPWLLLESGNEDGAIPVIGDANTIQYILHLGLGRELTVRGDGGKPARLRIVAALRDSVLQGELVISEADFLRIFPSQEGYRFFLLEAPGAESAAMAQRLMERLGNWGFSVESAHERLGAYHRVENTYLSTFQSLGALGLILGTAGMATVLLRNVLERRAELSLLRAVGYRKAVLAGIILAENAALLAGGLGIGLVSSMLAIMPALQARGLTFPFLMAGLILGGVMIVGLAASVLAVKAALRSPLLDALRSE